MKTLARQYAREEGSQALARAGMTETIEPWEDGLREQPRPGSLEWWYFDAHFADGSALVVVFMTKPTDASAGPISPLMKAQLTLPTGEIVSSIQPYPAEAFQASRDHCDVHIGPHWVRGDLHRYEFATQAPELSLHLTFTATVPAARTGTGRTLIGERDYLGWLVAIPRGTVEGTITVRGQTRTVHGEGYHDHNWGTLPFEDYLREWYWGRAYLGDYTIIFSLTHALPAYGNTTLPQILLARGSHILLTTGQGAQMRILRERQEQGAAVPELAAFTWNDAHNQVELTLQLTKILVNEVQGGVVRMQRFLANGTLRVTFNGAQEEEHGPVIYEHPTFLHTTN